MKRNGEGEGGGVHEGERKKERGESDRQIDRPRE